MIRYVQSIDSFVFTFDIIELQPLNIKIAPVFGNMNKYSLYYIPVVIWIARLSSLFGYRLIFTIGNRCLISAIFYSTMIPGRSYLNAGQNGEHEVVRYETLPKLNCFGFFWCTN